MARRDSAARMEELTREFDRTRQRLDGTLGELAERTKPANIVRRRVRRLRETGQELLSEVRAAADDYGEAGEPGYDDTRPIPPELVAVGVGLGAIAAIGLVVWLRRRRR